MPIADNKHFAEKDDSSSIKSDEVSKIIT